MWNRSFMIPFTQRFGNGRLRMRSYQNHVDIWASAWLGRINHTQSLRDQGQLNSADPMTTLNERVTLATWEDGKYFAAETVFTRGYTPFGVHRAWDYVRGDARRELKLRCPRFIEIETVDKPGDQNTSAKLKNRC